MSNNAERYDRSMRMFGAEGQQRLGETSVVIVGAGGLGSPLALELALLGVKAISIVDDDELDDTSRNRSFAAREHDPVPGSLKVHLTDRMIRETNTGVASTPIPHNLISDEAFAAVKAAEWVFGCMDEDGPRLVLTELCTAYEKPYIDLASDVPEPGKYGGHVVVANGSGCLHCLGLLDPKAVRHYLQTDEARLLDRNIYGVPKDALDGKGPSVAPLNGVIASLGAMEFMVAATGLRPPRRYIEYRGHESKVVVSTDEPNADCPYCIGVRGKGAEADVERYLHMPHLRERRRS